MEITLHKSHGFSIQGKRDYNEDSLYPDVSLSSQHPKLFLVCDGVGGSNRGEIASALACDGFREIEQWKKEAEEQEEPFVLTHELLTRLLKKTETEIDYYTEENPFAAGMATTVTLLAFHDAGATIGHIGDSRVYHIREGEILFQTRDHSYVQDLIDEGIITEEKAKTHPQRNVITRALQGGRKPTKFSTTIRQDIQAGDYFFLCSDGVLETWEDEDLCSLLSDPNISNEQKIEVIEANCAKLSSDNSTAYLVQVAAVEGEPVVEFDGGEQKKAAALTSTTVLPEEEMDEEAVELELEESEDEVELIEEDDEQHDEKQHSEEQNEEQDKGQEEEAGEEQNEQPLLETQDNAKEKPRLEERTKGHGPQSKKEAKAKKPPKKVNKLAEKQLTPEEERLNEGKEKKGFWRFWPFLLLLVGLILLLMPLFQGTGEDTEGLSAADTPAAAPALPQGEKPKAQAKSNAIMKTNEGNKVSDRTAQRSEEQPAPNPEEQEAESPEPNNDAAPAANGQGANAATPLDSPKVNTAPSSNLPPEAVTPPQNSGVTLKKMQDSTSEKWGFQQNGKWYIEAKYDAIIKTFGGAPETARVVLDKDTFDIYNNGTRVPR